MIKKLTLTTVAALGLFAGADAQIKKGDVMVGANLTDISFGLDKPNQFRLNINPKVAWFIQDGLALGADLQFGINTVKNAGTDISYGIGALGRYYGGSGTNEIVRNSKFFAEATVGVQGVNPSVGENTNGLGFSVGPGFSYFITPNIGLETLLKYNGVAGFGSSPYAHKLVLGVGFQIYLSGKGTLRKVKNDLGN